jgi:hypothetical protein
MNPILLPVAVGLILGAALIFIARNLGPKREPTVFAIGLLLAALIYAGFGIVGGAPLPWMALELAGVPVFGLIAWLGLKRSAGWLTFGWAAHAAWDAGLHLGSANLEFVPRWYPIFCGTLDLLVAAYLAFRGRAGGSGGVRT